MNRLHPMLLALIVLLLAACSSTPQRSPAIAAPRSTTPLSIAAPGVVQNGQLTPNLPRAGSGRGAYYKDDGPGDNPPIGLELTLDAEPKIEPYSNSGNKPYVVFGKTYTPMLDDKPFTERGTGSWYGKKFHGQKTSSGELYDMYKMTAAHPTLPIPSYARITNLSNGKQVIVKVNDRGPFHTNRIVDLSYTAALKLGYLGRGSSELLLERLLPGDIEKMAESRKNQPAVASVASSTPHTFTPVTAVPVTVAGVVAPAAAADIASKDSASLDALIQTKTSAEGSTASSAQVAAPIAQQEAAPLLVPVFASVLAPSVAPPGVRSGVSMPAVISTPNTSSGFYLQFGAFGLRSNAEATFTRLQSKLAQLPEFEIVQQGTLYRLFSGPFASRDDANNAIQMSVNVGVAKPIIVQR